MKSLFKILFVLIFSLFSICSYSSAEEIQPTKDYVFTSYDLMNSYEVNQIAKKIREHKYDKAEENLKYIPQMYRGAGEYYLCLGEVALHNNNLDLANVYFTKALEIVSDRYYGFHNQPLVYNEFAKMHFLKGNYEKALEYSDKAMESRQLEKEFVVTRINILKKYSPKNPKNIVKYTTFSNDIPELKDFKDNVETWEEVLNILVVFDAFEDNSEYTWGEIFSVTKKQKENKAK